MQLSWHPRHLRHLVGERPTRRSLLRYGKLNKPKPHKRPHRGYGRFVHEECNASRLAFHDSGVVPPRTELIAGWSTAPDVVADPLEVQLLAVDGNVHDERVPSVASEALRIGNLLPG